MNPTLLTGALQPVSLAAADIAHQQPASGVTALMWLVIALPLLGSALLLVGGRAAGLRTIPTPSCAARRSPPG